MFNLNVGILGHVDSGKTSLAKVLSQIASTAAFDKNPQSKARGITLDLGFSSFTVPVPTHLSNHLQTDEIQFTLVDCPGHAGLIRTIIGGAQIIDMMLLVVDITKGIQTQTAECLVIGELTCKKMIIVVNKLDQIPIAKQKHTIEKMTKKLKTTLAPMLFKDAPLVFIAANPVDGKSLGIQDLISTMLNESFIPFRDKLKPFLCAVDHCFGIKGKGTVLTGTILQGSIRVHDDLQIPLLNTSKKVKSIQMFRKPIEEAEQGDRVGICVTQFDSKLFERGIICAPDLAAYASGAIIIAEKIKYFKLPVKSKSKFHVTVGHETVMATITCFSIPKIALKKTDTFNFHLDYTYCKEILADEDSDTEMPTTYFILLEFEKAVLTVPNSLLIGSKLDMDIHGAMCRLAFWGTLLEIIKEKNYKNTFLPRLKICKMKKKVGVVDRLVNENELIAKNMFKKQTNAEQFVGLKVSLSTGEIGTITSQFGQNGKLKIHFLESLKIDTVKSLQNTIKKTNKDSVNDDTSKSIIVELEFKKYIYDIHKKIVQ